MFSPSTLPSLKGKIFLITGANTGIGLSTAQTLASKGATIYLGARSHPKALLAIDEIKTLYPTAIIHPLTMDHTSLSSIVSAAKEFLSKEKTLNGLILNAGIMAVPYEVTSDGF